MFCPKCATQNLEGASFCRTCGANISLVPQALTGQLPVQTGSSRREMRHRRRDGREVGLDTAFRTAFMGLGFLFVAIALGFSGMARFWWIFLLIPAFSMMASGLSQFVRVRERERQANQQHQSQPVFQPAAPAPALPRRNTGEMIPPPPSVTEGTTRHLGAEAATRHLDAADEVHR